MRKRNMISATVGAIALLVTSSAFADMGLGAEGTTAGSLSASGTGGSASNEVETDIDNRMGAPDGGAGDAELGAKSAVNGSIGRDGKPASHVGPATSAEAAKGAAAKGSLAASGGSGVIGGATSGTGNVSDARGLEAAGEATAGAIEPEARGAIGGGEENQR